MKENYFHYTFYLLGEGNIIGHGGIDKPQLNEVPGILAIHHVKFAGDEIHLVVCDSGWTSGDWRASAIELWQHVSPYSFRNQDHDDDTTDIDDEQPGQPPLFPW